MGRIAKILQFVRAVRNDLSSSKVNDVTVDPGGGANVTAENFTAAGDDSYPLKTDYALIVPVPSDRDVCLGFADTINTPKALEGDKRIYSRNPLTGNTVAEVWIKSDGTIIGVNQNGQFELQAGGDFIINGLTIDTSGNLTTSGNITGDNVTGNTEVNVGAVTLTGHSHCYIPGTNTPVSTAPPGACP